MRTPSRPRLVVLGLDGLPFTLARDLCSQGKLPHLAACFDPASDLASGSSSIAHPIRAELPELSPVNWTSFYTASGPETHGVYGFTRINAGTYEISLTDSSQVLAPTLPDHLARSGRVSRILNLPNTYPARPLTGMLVAGFPAPDLRAAVYPPPLAGMLAGAGYRLDADTANLGHEPEKLLQDLRQVLEARRKALDLLWPDLAWDLFVFVLTETDRLFHFLYPAVEQAGHPLHADCMAFFAAWDRVIGEVMERYAALPGPKELIILADHGFTALRTEVDLNVWLKQNGFLDLAPAAPAHELDASRILPSSKALALDPGRIYLHTSERFGRGCVARSEAAALMREIRAGLLELTHGDEPVMDRVLLADEAYPEQGPGRALAPDLVCVPRPGFDLKAKFDRSEIFGRFHRQGTHTADNAFFFHSSGQAAGRVRDAGTLALQFFANHDKTLAAA